MSKTEVVENMSPKKCCGVYCEIIGFNEGYIPNTTSLLELKDVEIIGNVHDKGE